MSNEPLYTPVYVVITTDNKTIMGVYLTEDEANKQMACINSYHQRFAYHQTFKVLEEMLGGRLYKIMKFIIGNEYTDRVGRIWVCRKPIFGSLPTFQNNNEIVVQHPSGNYRWDGKEHERDIIK